MGLTSVMTKVCSECFSICTGLADCLKLQEFNIIVENAKAIAKLKKTIVATPTYRGSSQFFKIKNTSFGKRKFSEDEPFYSRFLTITFDPKKFTFAQLTNTELMINYTLNALWSIRQLFKHNIKLVFEFHKSGLLHCHINYECEDVFNHMSLLLRLRYYFSKSLKNKHCIHDRIFNDGGKQYISKANEEYYYFNMETFKEKKPIEISF